MELSEEIKFSSLMPDKLDITTAKAETFRHWQQQWKDYCQLAPLDDQVRTGSLNQGVKDIQGLLKFTKLWDKAHSNPQFSYSASAC